MSNLSLELNIDATLSYDPFLKCGGLGRDVGEHSRCLKKQLCILH